MDKLDKLYNLYLSNGLISKATPIDKFKSASDEQRAKLYELGKSSGLFATTDLNTFSSAWGGLSIDKKKEDSALPSMEEGTSLATPKMESPKPLGSSPTKQVKNPSNFNKNIESSDYQRHTKLASVAINAADKGDKQTLINTLKEMNAIRAMYPAGVFESDKQMTEDLQSIEKVAGRKKLDVDINTATRMPVAQPKINLGMPVESKAKTKEAQVAEREKALESSKRGIFENVYVDPLTITSVGTPEQRASELQKRFGDLGFTFKPQEAKIFGEDIVVTADDGSSINISLSDIYSEDKKQEAKKLQDFLFSKSGGQKKREMTPEEMLVYSKRDNYQNIPKAQYDRVYTDENIKKSLNFVNKKINSDLEGVKESQKELVQLEAEIDKLGATAPQELIDKYNSMAQVYNSKVKDIKASAAMGDQAVKNVLAERLEREKDKGNWASATYNGFVNGVEDLAKGAVYMAFEGTDILTMGLMDDYKKYAQEDYANKAIEKGAEMLRAKGVSEEYIKSGNWAKQALFSVPEFIPTLFIPGGPIARISTMTTQGVGRRMDEYNKDPEMQKMMSRDEAFLVNLLKSTVEAMLENVGITQALSGQGLANSLVVKALQKWSPAMGNKALNALLNTEVNNLAAKAVLNTAGAFIAEAETGALQNIMETSLNELYNVAKEKQVFDQPKVFTKDWMDGLVKDAVMEGLGGMWMGGAINVAKYTTEGVLGAKLNNEEFAIVKAMLKDGVTAEAMLVDLKARVLSGKMTRDEMKSAIRSFNKAATIVDQMPEGDLSNRQQRAAFDLLNERMKLQEEIAGKDPNLVEKKKKRINEINEKLKNISENAVQEQATSEVPLQPEAGVGEEVAQGKPQAEPQGVAEEGVQEVKIDRPSILSNAKVEVDTVVAATPETETGQTFNIDGTVYLNGGLVVPVVSENLTQEELTPERIADFVEANRDKIGANAVKVGIYKFPNSNQVSIDLNIVVPKNNRKAALEFARLAGQESLFDLDTFENVKTGSDGKNPMQFSAVQFVEIAKALEGGRMPEVFETVQQPAAQTIKETDDNYQESRDTVMQIAQEQDEFVPGDAVLEQVTTDANGNVTGGTVSFLDADRNKTTKTISREQKEQVAEQRQPQASDKAKIAENVKKAIAKLFPKLDSKTFRSADAMREYAREKYGDEIADQIQDDDAARVLLGKDNMPVAILVNEEFSDETTFPHEAWHPILLKAFGDNQKLFGEFRDSIRKALIDNGYKDIADKLDAFANQKEYKDTGVVAEEWLAQFGGMLTSAGIDAKKLTKKQKSLLNQIKDIVNKFAVRIAGQPVFLENATPDTILDFMVSLSDMMARGEDISGLIGGGYKSTEAKTRAQIVGAFDGQLAKMGISVGTTNEKTGKTKVTNFDIASALNEYYKKEYGTISPSDFSDKTVDIVADYATTEMLFALSKFGSESGKGWYTEDYSKALDTLSSLDSDIAKDKATKEIATAIIAVASNSSDVYTNLTRVIYGISKFKETGKVPSDVGTGKGASAIAAGINRYNELLGKFDNDPTKVASFMQQIDTISNLKKKLLSEFGLNSYAQALNENLATNPEWNENETLPMSVLIFGPKIGAFYSNLSGLDGTPTIDRWCIRTIYRYKGDMRAKVSEKELNDFATENKINGASESDILSLAEEHSKLFDSILTGRGKFKGLEKSKRNEMLKPYRKGSQIWSKAKGVVNDISEGADNSVKNKSQYGKDFRSFTKKVFEKARDIVAKESGVKLSVSDVQAILWIYEKNLFGHLGVKQREDATYSSAAQSLVNKVKSGALNVDMLKSGDLKALSVADIETEGPMGDKFGSDAGLYKQGIDNRQERSEESIGTKTRAQKTIQQANEDFGTEDGEAVFGTRAQKIDNKELSKLSNEISSKVENKDLVELKSLINDVEAPKKTIKAYKLFKVKKGFPGELFPLFVGANESVTVGEWIEAKAGELTQTKEGKTMVKSTLGPLAYRPGWHSGDIAVATHIGSKKNASDKAPTLRAEDQVWAEVEVGNDFDWQKEANNRAEKTKDGKINLRTAHITDQIPSKGFYKYKTNSNMTGSWIISGEMKVNRVLTEKEVEEINKKANAKDLPRLAPFDYEAYGFNEDGSVKNQKQVISNQVARAYIVAKETGENPELVKAVEEKITTRAQKKEFEATDRDFVLPFGKYEGQWFTTTPAGYRDWLTSQPWFNANKYLKPKEPKVTTKAQKAPTHVPDSVYKYLTEDGNGNIVFHHYSRERRDVVRPSTGSGSLLTSREEAQALSSVGGLGMYYAQLGQKEPGVGDERHTVVVPKEKIYYMTTDPLNLYDEARARFMDYMNRNNDIQIEYAFNPNYQVAWITKVAQEKGFDMVISKWKNDADYRAQSAIPLKPIKEDIQMKATDEAIEVGDKVFVYGAPAVVLDIDADGIATYKSANSSGKFDIPYSEKSMRYGKMTLLEKGPFEMDENMEIVLKTRGQKSSYDRMIDELDGVIQKSRERKVSKEKVYQNALAYLQGSKVYEQADDVEREEMVRDLRAKLGLKEKSVARIFSLKRKEPGITINEKQALRDQIRLEAKAAKDAIQARQRIAAMIKDQLSGLFKKGVIKTPQLQAITRKLLQLNFFNQDHVDNFINYMDKVFRDAEYADKLAKANTLQSRIKRAVKDKTIQAETRDTAKEFVKLAPYLAADIDAYLAIAEEVYEAVQQTKGTVTEGIASVTFKKAMNYEKVQDYTKKEAAAQEDIRKQQVLDKNAYLVEAGVLDENMSLKEMMAIIQSIEANPEKQIDKEKEKTIRDYVNKYFNSYKTILEEIIRTDIDPFTGERMYLTEAQRSQVKKFLAVDLNVLSLKDAYHMVNAIDNFVMNQNLDGMEATIAAYKGIENMEEAERIGLVARPLRTYWSGLLGRKWGENFEQITMMHERLFGGVERGLMFDRLSGLSKLLRDKIIALKQHNSVVEKYSTLFGKIKDFNKAENVFERGMLGITARNVQGSAIEQQEEFNKQKNNIRISINAMKQGTDKQKKEAVVAQQVYDKILKDSNSYQEARSKANENNVKAVEFWQNEFAGIFDTLQDVSRGVYNTILDRDVNYLPHTYKRFEDKGDNMDVSEEGSAFMGMNEGFDMKETGVLMKATKPRLTEEKIPSRILSFDFDMNMSRAMQGALIDINTASTIRQISAFYNSEGFIKLIPKKEDRILARRRMTSFIKKVKKKQYVQEDNLDAMARVANYISSFSAGRALGSLSQVPKQTISVAANTMINTGGNIAIIDVFSAKDFIDKSGYAISIRGIASQADIQTINQILKKAEESKGKQALDYIKKLNDMYLELFVANSDVFIARASWLAYYKKKLSKLGINTSEIDWSTHEINTEAADYAQRMTDRQQNFSDADLAGEIMSNQKPIVQLLRKSLFPFASFGINKKAQLMGDMSVLYNPLSSSDDKKAAVRSLASWGVEMGVYSAVRIFIGKVVYDFISNLMAGYDEDEEEKKKKITKALQYEAKNAVVELFSPIPNVADDALVDGLNFTLDAVGVDDMYRLPEGKGEKLYEKVGLTNIMQQKLANLGRMTYAGATGTYVDKFGNAKDMSKEDQERAAAMAAVYAFYAFGFVPADIGMTIDNAYYKLGRKSSSRKSGGGGKSSFGSISTKIK